MQRCPRARHAPSEIASLLVGVGQALVSLSSEYTLLNKSHCPFVSSRGPFEKDVFRISKGVWMEGSLCPKAISLDRESEQTNTPYSLILKPWELQESQLLFFCVLCVQQLCCWPLSFRTILSRLFQTSGRTRLTAEHSENEGNTPACGLWSLELGTCCTPGNQAPSFQWLPCHLVH